MTAFSKCVKCGETKPVDEFNKGSNGREHHSYCRTCHRMYIREARFKREYGITTDHYAKMMDDQNGCCAICGESNQAGHPLAVDHCHDSREVRGLLCHRCNVGLGMFQDDVEKLKRAIEYLGE